MGYDCFVKVITGFIIPQKEFAEALIYALKKLEKESPKILLEDDSLVLPLYEVSTIELMQHMKHYPLGDSNWGKQGLKDLGFSGLSVDYGANDLSEPHYTNDLVVYVKESKFVSSWDPSYLSDTHREENKKATELLQNALRLLNLDRRIDYVIRMFVA